MSGKKNVTKQTFSALQTVKRNNWRSVWTGLEGYMPIKTNTEVKRANGEMKTDQFEDESEGRMRTEITIK